MGYKDPTQRRAYYADYRIRNREKINRQKKARRAGGPIARRASLVVHGHAANGKPTKEYRAWKSAKSRCLNPNQTNWKYYGARGISMCQKWLLSFTAFYADMGPCPPGLTLERIDNDKGYEPGNCKWATVAEQNKNKRRTL